MTRNIFRSILCTTLLLLLIACTGIVGILFQKTRDIQKNQLRTELKLVAVGVEKEGLPYLQSLSPLPTRLTWINASGTVLYDSSVTANHMENHLNREEILEALQTGMGESTRYSQTLTRETLYAATKLSDGSILRISIAFSTIPVLLLGFIEPLFLLLLLTCLLSLWMAKRLSHRIVEPLNHINFESPLSNETYDELAPFLTRMDQQRQEILEQKQALLKQKNEFEIIIHSLSEGLILLDSKGKILHLNPAATEFFSLPNPVGKHLTDLERAPQWERGIRSANQGEEVSFVVERLNRVYQIYLHAIEQEASCNRMVLLLFDITDRIRAEHNRHTFTANVSHELKTPLQTIMGSAELLENGLIQPEDQPRFIQHIRQEAKRLISMIEDVIRLSQLEDERLPEAETIEISTLIQTVLQTLTPLAQSRSVTLEFDGAPLHWTGVAKLLQEILYNLCTNAIQYNTVGGQVRVTLTRENETAKLTIADTGIGIPQEHQAHIFERFYRVDSSRSQKTGGTGLGLSIVKHAVQKLGGKLTLQSKPQQGTTICLTWPLHPPLL